MFSQNCMAKGDVQNMFDNKYVQKPQIWVSPNVTQGLVSTFVSITEKHYGTLLSLSCLFSNTALMKNG